MNDKFSEKPPFYLTSAISYPNGEPHIGHAYELVGADTIARFKRLDGFDVRFVTGTDEHGVKMAKTAEAKGISVRELADTNSARFQALGEELNLSIDEFVRTTEPRHAKSVQDLWRRMVANGDIYEGAYAGWYSVRDEAYYDESELTEGTEGQKLSPQGTEVEWVEEPSFFFRLSDFEDRLLSFYDNNPDFMAPPERRNEVISFVKSGLNDLSISRTTFDWGVPVPDVTGHVMYVWVDALTAYITGLGYPDDEIGHFAKFWPADLHVIGKDIVRFHTVYWPAFLMSAGLPLPKRVFGHGFLTVDGKKMSKSLGNVIDPLELTEEFGADAVRYYFLREVSFGHDGDYGRAKFIKRINADLANDLGNLAQRSLSMVAKHCEGEVPTPGAFSDADRQILAAADALLGPVREAVDKQALHKMLALVWQVVADANRYFAGEEPWALRKNDPTRMKTVLYVTAEIIRQVAILAQPVMPASADKLLHLLNIDEDKRDFCALGEAGRLKSGTNLPTPHGVFPRFVEKEAGEAAT